MRIFRTVIIGATLVVAAGSLAAQAQAQTPQSTCGKPLRQAH
jgi:hypothetical protein